MVNFIAGFGEKVEEYEPHSFERVREHSSPAGRDALSRSRGQREKKSRCWGQGHG